MNHRSIVFLMSFFIGAVQAAPLQEAQLTQTSSAGVVIPKSAIPGIDAGRVMKRTEYYKTLINQTICNKRIAWFSGGLLASGCLLYLVTDGFASSEKTGTKKPGKKIKGRNKVADEAFNEWWQEEQETRRSVWGSSRRGIAEGFKLGFVSVVVGLLLKAFDNATNTLSDFSDNILGRDEDVLFEQVNRSVLFSFDCMAISLQTLVGELALFSSTGGKSLKIPSFFYEAVFADLQALSRQIEEHMGLVFAIVSLNEKNGDGIGQAMEMLTSIVDGAVAYALFLQQQGEAIDLTLVRQEALIVEKKVFRSIERYLMTCKSTLFENA